MDIFTIQTIFQEPTINLHSNFSPNRIFLFSGLQNPHYLKIMSRAVNIPCRIMKKNLP